MQTLLAGTQIPDVAAKDQTGNTIRLQDYSGSKIVLYFYPEDDTPACTKEACNLRDNYGLLTQKGIKLFGVSMNTDVEHQQFIEKFSLPFPLIADTERAFCDAYGAYGEKNMYGKKYMGIHRVTFLIDEAGKIAHVIKKVKTDAHTEQILALWGLA